MINYEIETVTEEKQVPKSITCDVCKKIFSYKDDWMEIQEFHHIRFRGGYGSIFGDDVCMKSDICQHCLEKILGEYIEVDEERMELSQ